MFRHDIHLETTRIADLRPTQMTVGFREVAAKRAHWRSLSEDKVTPFVGTHMIPVVIGPKARVYVIDHHHLSRALLDEEVEGVLTQTLADLSHLSKAAFWVFLDNRGWCHPYDAHGVRCEFSKIPKSIAGLVDDPYRALAGEVRTQGGYAKNSIPFSAFMWADFFRRQLQAGLVTSDFDAALTAALELARHPIAGYLPGWCGPNSSSRFPS